MFIHNAPEYPIPIRPAKVGGSPQRSDGVLLCTNVLYDDVVHVVFLDLGSKVDVDLDSVLRVLFFDGVKERMEPFGSAKVTDYPCKVDLWR
jgi:hypothetical protein